MLILNKTKAVRLTYQDLSLDRIIISINDINKNKPKFNLNNYSIKNILYVFFDDVIEGEKGAMTIDDAKKIINFVLDNYKNCNQIIVHCEAGVSRSAGVAAGICELLGINNDYIWENDEYCPNIYCYKILKKQIKELRNGY